MSVKVENLEKNMAKLTVEVDNAEFLKAIDVAYKKNRNKFNLPGFRKGKAPKEMIMKMYGPQVFFEDALNEILDKTYPEAAKESGLQTRDRRRADRYGSECDLHSNRCCKAGGYPR